MTLSRRGFLAGLGAGLIAAPAIVKASSLMPVRDRLFTARTTLFAGELGQYEGVRFTAADVRRAMKAMEANNIPRMPDGNYFYIVDPGWKPYLRGELEGSGFFALIEREMI